MLGRVSAPPSYLTQPTLSGPEYAACLREAVEDVSLAIGDYLQETDNPENQAGSKALAAMAWDNLNELCKKKWVGPALIPGLGTAHRYALNVLAKAPSDDEVSRGQRSFDETFTENSMREFQGLWNLLDQGIQQYELDFLNGKASVGHEAEAKPSKNAEPPESGPPSLRQIPLPDPTDIPAYSVPPASVISSRMVELADALNQVRAIVRGHVSSSGLPGSLRPALTRSMFLSAWDNLFESFGIAFKDRPIRVPSEPPGEAHLALRMHFLYVSVDKWRMIDRAEQIAARGGGKMGLDPVNWRNVDPVEANAAGGGETFVAHLDSDFLRAIDNLGESLRELTEAWQRIRDGESPVTSPHEAQTPQTEPPKAPDHSYDLVTLNQAAGIVHRSKRTLERYKTKGELPAPLHEGGGGMADLYDWKILRLWLMERFGMNLPDIFPANRRK